MLKKKMIMYFIVMFAVAAFFAGFSESHKCSADIVVEAEEDSFVKRHREEMEEVDRLYIVNAFSYSAEIYKSPISVRVQDQIMDGTQIFIKYVYTDEYERSWGYSRIFDGWISMDYLVKKYSAQDFERDYADEIIKYDTVMTFEKASDRDVFCYSYPCADDFYNMIDNQDEEVKEFEYTELYKDYKDRRWIKTELYYNTEPVWICIDAENTSPYSLYGDEGAPAMTEDTSFYIKGKIKKPSKEITPKAEKLTTDMKIWIILAVCAVLVAAGATVLLIRNRRKAQAQSEPNSSKSGS